MRENKKLLALQYLLQYLVMPGIKKPGSFDLLGQACGLGS
jgi:hypothetical protein